MKNYVIQVLYNISHVCYVKHDLFYWNHLNNYIDIRKEQTGEALRGGGVDPHKNDKLDRQIKLFVFSVTETVGFHNETYNEISPSRTLSYYASLLSLILPLHMIQIQKFVRENISCIDRYGKMG